MYSEGRVTLTLHCFHLSMIHDILTYLLILSSIHSKNKVLTAQVAARAALHGGGNVGMIASGVYVIGALLTVVILLILIVVMFVVISKWQQKSFNLTIKVCVLKHTLLY